MTNTMLFAALVWIAFTSMASFCAMGADKRRARMKLRRVRERTLFIWALLGGSIGAILGMWAFRHKTRHWYFVLGMPAILALQLALVYIILHYLQ